MHSQPQRLSAYGVLLVTLLFMTFTVVQIARTPQVPYFDQLFIQSTFDNGFPTIASGITSRLIADLVNQALDAKAVDLTRTNSVIRILAACLYLAAGGLLSWSLLKRHQVAGTVLFLLFLLTSRYPFLWLSSELFAGAFLMLYLWSMLSHQVFAIRALFLALFAFSKPDLLLPAIVVGIYETIFEVDSNGNSIVRVSGLRIATVAALFALFVLPWLLSGNPLSGTGVAQRSLMSFAQHYAALVYSHQIVPAPEPWQNAQIYVQATFGPVSSVLDAVLAKPSLYMDFVSLSVAKSLRNSITSYILFLVPLVAYYWQLVRPKKLKVVTLLLLTNLIPILLLSFVHVRYEARFYPLALAIVFAGVFQESTNDKSQSWKRYIIYGYLALLLILQTYLALGVFQQGYWVKE